MARVRVHQHVNPLADFYQNIPVEPVKTEESFASPDNNLHIDIGCGRGRFLLKQAAENTDLNYIGLEIRKPLVDEANQLAEERALKNIKYIFCNAPLDLGVILEQVPSKKLELFSIQFPDPWFKKRHAKRRMVNSALVELIKNNSAENTQVFVQTDIEELFEEMTSLFSEAGFSKELLDENIFGLKTEREISVENRNLPVFRSIHSLK